jgi:two-component system, NarL family, invasion response regulator UvrY
MRILLIDDHRSVGEGVRRLLESSLETSVSIAADGRNALLMVQDQRPDLILLDLNLPDICGFDLLRRLLDGDSKVRILVFSMHESPVYAERALSIGARGYLSKSATAEELVSAVRKLASGGRYIQHVIALSMASRRVAGCVEKLTGREIEILSLLGVGSTLQQIAQQLDVSHKTIVNPCTLIKSKLLLDSTVDLIRYALTIATSKQQIGE